MTQAVVDELDEDELFELISMQEQREVRRRSSVRGASSFAAAASRAAAGSAAGAGIEIPETSSSERSNPIHPSRASTIQEADNEYASSYESNASHMEV